MFLGHSDSFRVSFHFKNYTTVSFPFFGFEGVGLFDTLPCARTCVVREASNAMIYNFRVPEAEPCVAEASPWTIALASATLACPLCSCERGESMRERDGYCQSSKYESMAWEIKKGRKRMNELTNPVAWRTCPTFSCSLPDFANFAASFCSCSVT